MDIETLSNPGVQKHFSNVSIFLGLVLEEASSIPAEIRHLAEARQKPCEEKTSGKLIDSGRNRNTGFIVEDTASDLC